MCSVKTRQWFSIIFISILHETAVGCILVISAPVWELISSSKSLQQSEKGFFCPSSLSPFVLGWLMSQLYRDTPQCLSAFVLNQISHLWQKQVSEHQLQLFFFFLFVCSIPQTPVRPRYFLPFPLVVVGSLLTSIKVNEPQLHAVSQLGEPILAFKWSAEGPELFLQR